MSPRTGWRFLPEPIVRHIRRSFYSRAHYPHLYHVTTLVYCLLKAYFSRVHSGSSDRGVKGMFNIYRGRMYDDAFSPLFRVNQRTFTDTRDEVTVTGTLDFVYDASDGEGPVLYDLKAPASTYYKKRYGAGQGYRRQVKSYLALAHENGELLDVHKARVLMLAEDVVVEEVEEEEGFLDWLWYRARVLDRAIEEETPILLWGPEEEWECDERYCPASGEFREKYC